MCPSCFFAPAISLVMTVLLAALCINIGLRFNAIRAFPALTAATWAGGKMIIPLGPSLWGVPWLPYVVAGFTAAAAYGGFMFLSHYMSRTIAAQLDSLVAARQVMRTLSSERMIMAKQGARGPFFDHKG